MEKEALDPRTEKMARHIKKLREDLGYTSSEAFALDKELNRVQYWRMEAGANLRLSSLYQILDAHGLTLEEFAKGAGV